ncbi:MAG: glycoside hydrolase family 78 protein [Caldilineaceae bacterium]
MTTVANLRCEYRINPLGIDVSAPRFSWQLISDRTGAAQTAYRVRAASSLDRLQADEADLWDSGRIESDQSIQVAYAGSKLSSRQRAYWDVTDWDETGAATTSEPAWFEMGLLESSDWQADWIGCNLVGGPHSNVPAPYLRRAFELPDAVESARLYVSALGLYECSINGQVVGDEVFAPGWTDYRKRIQYMVYDVTELLASGENVIGAVLGDGWAAGYVGMITRQQYVQQPQFFAQLEVTLPNDNRITICSDGDWMHQFGPLLENDLLMGEAYDARLELSDWNMPGYDSSGWMPVRVFANPWANLVATNGPVVRRVAELKPVVEPRVVERIDSRSVYYDLGQNMVGRVRFQGIAPEGTTVTFRFAEVLAEDGSLYTDNLRGARATDFYTFKGDGVEVWEPKFTFHGFRYVEIKGYPGELETDTITGIVLHSDIAQTGVFSTSAPLINQLQHNILWGQKGNFVDVPTDCPQRDERLGWTGDIQVFVRTAAFNMDVAGFMTKWMRDLADAQSDRGEVPAVVPKAIAGLPDGGPAWADAAIVCPWTIYLCYGDTRILEQNYDVMQRLMGFLLDTSPGYIRCAPEYEGWPGFGDWLSINADTPRDLIGTAFLAYDAALLAKIATVLGKDEDAGKYQNLLVDVRQAFQDRYLKGSNARPSERVSQRRLMMDQADAISRGNLERVDYGTTTSEVFNTELFSPNQTAYVLALHFGLLPEELRDQAVDELVADIERRNWHLSTGFVGAPYLPHVLSENGRLDVAYKLLNQRTWPSWLYSVTQGATTIWERWDGWTEENGFQSAEMNSFNHYAYGSIGAWLYNTVAGIDIDPEQPGYKHALLRPQPGGALIEAKGALETPYGRLSSAWRLEGDSFVWDVTIPPNTTATAYLPDGVVAAKLDGEPVTSMEIPLRSGTATIEAEMDE